MHVLWTALKPFALYRQRVGEPHQSHLRRTVVGLHQTNTSVLYCGSRKTMSFLCELREDTHKKVVFFSGRTTKRGEGGNPPDH